MSDTFKKYGFSFQVKLMAALFTDKIFLQQITDILDPKYFESETNIWIVRSVMEYFEKYKQQPTLEVMKVELEKVENDVLKATIVENLREVTKHLHTTDQDYIKDEAINFCKNQVIKKAIMESVELLQLGEYDEIKTKIDNAMKAGSERDIGHEYNIDIDDRFSETTRKTVATGWESINSVMDGGLGPGELGVFVAPAGIGKSWGLVNVAAEAVKNGLNVIHYTLELSAPYVGLRFDSVFTGIPSQNLKYHIDEIKETVGNLDGNLVVKYYPTKGATVNTLKAHVEKCIIQDKKPDVIIVDYADLLRGTGNRNQDLRHELGNIYEDLRGMAGEYEIPVWTASQANRSALEEDVIGAEKIAEAYSKIMTADFVISLSRKIEDKIAGTGRWHVIKNRFGPDGLTFPSKMNTSTGQINIYDETSVQGRQTQKTMDTGDELLRKRLSNKFSELTD
jgi:replicative DNA helicase